MLDLDGYLVAKAFSLSFIFSFIQDLSIGSVRLLCYRLLVTCDGNVALIFGNMEIMWLNPW